jgi:uncharacterized protein YjiS (DUF1127 family)
MTRSLVPHIGLHAGKAGKPAIAGLKLWLAALAKEWRVRRALRALQDVDDRMLHDIGLDRGGIEDAVRRGRPLRRASELPAHWGRYR